MDLINEELARRSKENYSFTDYIPGSATAEYNKVIADATEQIENAKLKVSEEGKQRLDNLLDRYKINYANWINKSNSNGANHVSIMISGASNYNMKAHEKYLSRERSLMAEYDEIMEIDNKIWSIVNGDNIIKSDDVNAICKLKEKLLKAQEEHQGYKDYNIKARKEGKEALPAYVLANSNGRIKGIKDRVEHLERIAKAAAETTAEEQTTEINGIQIIDNLEAQRLQIIFPDKPDLNTRTELKKHGFRWCPTNSAWQRYRSPEAETAAKEIVNKLFKFTMNEEDKK